VLSSLHVFPSWNANRGGTLSCKTIAFNNYGVWAATMASEGTCGKSESGFRMPIEGRINWNDVFWFPGGLQIPRRFP
jgi:hypothetical protein